MPKKIRVYELAKELGLTNKEGLELALSLGIGVKSHSSSIEDAQADRVRRKADAEGLRRPVQPEEPPAAKKAAKATKKATAATTRAPEAEDGTPTDTAAPAKKAVASSSGASAPSRRAPQEGAGAHGGRPAGGRTDRAGDRG